MIADPPVKWNRQRVGSRAIDGQPVDLTVAVEAAVPCGAKLPKPGLEKCHRHFQRVLRHRQHSTASSSSNMFQLAAISFKLTAARAYLLAFKYDTVMHCSALKVGQQTLTYIMT